MKGTAHTGEHSRRTVVARYLTEKSVPLFKTCSIYGISQINLQQSRNSTAELVKIMNRNRGDNVIIQEPYFFRDNIKNCKELNLKPTKSPQRSSNYISEHQGFNNSSLEIQVPRNENVIKASLS